MRAKKRSRKLILSFLIFSIICILIFLVYVAENVIRFRHKRNDVVAVGSSCPSYRDQMIAVCFPGLKEWIELSPSEEIKYRLDIGDWSYISE